MIVITRNFAGILDDWLASRGLAPPNRGAARRNANGNGSTGLTLAQWTAAVKGAIALAPGPARGLEIGKHVQLQHTGPLGYLLVNTRDLGGFLDTYLLLEKWFYGRNWARLDRFDTETSIAWDDRFGPHSRELEQLHAMALVTIALAACPSARGPVRVEMMSAANGEANAYRAAFGCPVKFNQPHMRIAFAADAMQAPVDLHHAALSPVWRTHQRTLRETLPSATELVRAVQEAMLHTLPAGAPADAVAAQLHLSRRTLQRRLSEAGCSYRQLLDGIRERHATQLFGDASLSRRDVAFLLGYAEQSAFNHAAQRWRAASLAQIIKT